MQGGDGFVGETTSSCKSSLDYNTHTHAHTHTHTHARTHARTGKTLATSAHMHTLLTSASPKTLTYWGVLFNAIVVAR